jgi:hypothetical protein
VFVLLSSQKPFPSLKLAVWQAIFLLSCFFCVALAIQAQENVSIKMEGDEMVIDGKNDNPVYSVGKNVRIKSEAKEVLCFGCDVIIEGRVDGDVAVVGGTIVQKREAFIGGDVMVFFGKYEHESETPLRNAETRTFAIAGFEDEMRHWMQNPMEIFAPQLSVSFISLRLIVVLFWFLIALAATTIAPGAVSRAVARFQLSSLKVVGVGFLGVLSGTVIIALCIGFAADYIVLLVGLMLLFLVFLSYVYGRVTIQAVIGKWLLKRISSKNKQSEALTHLVGSFCCTAILSLPYIWTFAIFVMLVISVGLVLTGIFGGGWKKAEKM